jgi:uncharacterized membrane protein YeaQ/YmgE (transglycosylase-associated protein family)
MELIKLILWLSVGTVIGWFARQMVKRERGWTHKPFTDQDRSS